VREDRRRPLRGDHHEQQRQHRDPQRLGEVVGGRVRAVGGRLGRLGVLAFAGAAALAVAFRAAPSGSARGAVGHVWIVVSEGAPERASLERAGFHVAPTVNRNEGSGTSSISIEFVNGYLELMWPDPSVSVASGRERGPEKFRRRMTWRTSGSCPFGIG